MKGAVLIFAMLMAMLFVSDGSFAGRAYVRGHFRKNGFYVAPHYRSSPDGYFNNNWSTYGNINPYTGEIGTRRYPSMNQHSGASGVGLHKSAIPDFYLAPVPSQLHGKHYDLRSFAFPLPAVDSTPSDQNTILAPADEPIPPDVDSCIIRNAESSWPNDFSMQAYTIQSQRDGYAKLSGNIRLFLSIGVPKDIINWCLAYASRSWPSDYSMQAYAFDNSTEGYMKLSASLSSDEWKSLPESVSSSILQNADAIWNNDVSMQAYYVENQIDGFYKISALLSALDRAPENIQYSILEKARSSWSNDLSMQAYCIESELDGYLRLKRLKDGVK